MSAPNCPDCVNHICTILHRCERVALGEQPAGYAWGLVLGSDVPVPVSILAPAQVDTRRMAETGTGSVRSTGSAVPEGDAP